MERQTLDLVPIIPMKPLSGSKSRLSRDFSRQQRENLALGMLRRVVSALQSASVDEFWVVGGDARVRQLAEGSRGVWLEEMGKNLNDTLGKAIDRAFDQGKSAMYLASDLPFVKASDIHSLLQSSRQQSNISLAPARRDGGTNAILVPHGVTFRPQLGPRSFINHLSQAARMGISVAICYSPGLGFDLDTSADLETYEQMEPGFVERLVSGRDAPEA